MKKAVMWTAGSRAFANGWRFFGVLKEPLHADGRGAGFLYFHVMQIVPEILVCICKKNKKMLFIILSNEIRI